jgi:hypothetical protein
MRPTDDKGLNADTTASTPGLGKSGKHGHGDHGGGHPYDREIDLRSIGKWMGGLLAVTVVVQVLMWWMIRGIERFDAKGDPALTPIQQANPQQLPPYPRLQTAPGFADNEPNAWSKSDVEDMKDLYAEENKVLDQPTWINQGEGRLRVPIDVAMEVIASRGNQGMGVGTGAAAGTVTPQEMREQLPAGTSPGAPGATVQMSRPDTPAQVSEPPAAGAQGARQQQQQNPRPPASQEQ